MNDTKLHAILTREIVVHIRPSARHRSPETLMTELTDERSSLLTVKVNIVAPPKKPDMTRAKAPVILPMARLYAEFSSTSFTVLFDKDYEFTADRRYAAAQTSLVAPLSVSDLPAIDRRIESPRGAHALCAIAFESSSTTPGEDRPTLPEFVYPRPHRRRSLHRNEPHTRYRWTRGQRTSG